MKEILCITSYPPRECGIATFSSDLIQAIHNKFGETYSIKVCALETTFEKHHYSDHVKYILNTSDILAFTTIAEQINQDSEIELICIQHEFGLFGQKGWYLQFIRTLKKPVIIVFHTVLPNPDKILKQYLQQIAGSCASIIVMTNTSSHILQQEYQIDQEKINVIPHGTHLVSHVDKRKLKEQYGYSSRKILTTFGLLSPGKSIETTLDALPAIIKANPSVLFLIIGKTHPTILKEQGETYREMLEAKVIELGLSDHVSFINYYLGTNELLEYLQLTDIYLFTSSDPTQAVSGTFVYALSCGCPIIATPIPHALELLAENSGIIFNFKDSGQLADSTNKLLHDKKLQHKMRITGLQKIAATAWENTAVAYALLFKKIIGFKEKLKYSLPPLNINHIKRLSRNFAMIQFSKGNRPDISTGYTLDDNARALMALSMMYIRTRNKACKVYIKSYLKFIKYCMQADGSFLNYVDRERTFTEQNHQVDLEDSNARAVCALGYFISLENKFPNSYISEAIHMFQLTLPRLHSLQSPRSIAFTIKGLSYYHANYPSTKIYQLIKLLADRLVDCYKANADENWLWFEAYLTYDNSILPESLLNAYLITKDESYKKIAKESFDFMLQKIFTNNQIKVISNQGWLQKEETNHKYGEQPIDVAGTITAFTSFYNTFGNDDYLVKQEDAFNWFLGNNHLHQIVYNPKTGGCYDGLEENNINLNQGAESSVCYLLARLSLIY